MYKCNVCGMKFNTDLTEQCPECNELVWYGKRLNLIRLTQYLEDEGISYSLREVLYNPTMYSSVWESIINR